MNKNEAIAKLQSLQGKELRLLAEEHNIMVFNKDGKKNKGWAGQTINKALGLGLNTTRKKQLGNWALKIVSFVSNRSKTLIPKETLAITMLDPHNVLTKSFEESHLFHKLQNLILCARTWDSPEEIHSTIFFVTSFELNPNTPLYQTIKEDYLLIQKTIQEKGFQALTGNLGVLIQARTKGCKNSTTRAFYARKSLLNHLIMLPE